MRKGGDHTRAHHQRIGGGNGTDDIADDENHHQPQQHPLARHMRGEDGHDRCAEYDAQRITGNQQARLCDGNAEIGANFTQQPHDDEFGDTDSEGPGSQGIKSNRHCRTSCCSNEGCSGR